MDRKMSRKLIAILTICTMIALMLPTYALADEEVPEDNGVVQNGEEPVGQDEGVPTEEEPAEEEPVEGEEKNLRERKTEKGKNLRKMRKSLKRPKKKWTLQASGLCRRLNWQ
jgi:hypothetical protein